MKFKLDENLSPSLADIFSAGGHEAHSITVQKLNGQPDNHIIDICNREQRVLVTPDTDFSNILVYPPAQFSGIVVLRLTDKAHMTVVAAVRRVIGLLPHEIIMGMLWVVEENLIRIHG